MKRIFNEEDINDGEWFFGDEARQQEIIDHLGKSLRGNTGKIYIVAGESRSGKSASLDTVQENFGLDKSFVELKTPKLYLGTTSLGELKREVDRTHKIFESNSATPHEVLFIEEVILPREEQKLRAIIDAHHRLPSTVGPLSIVIDVSTRDGSILPGVQTISQARARKEFKECLERVAKDYPEVEVLQTKYDKKNIKEELWRMGEDYYYAPDIVSEYVEGYGIDIGHPAVRDLLKAIKTQNRDKFELAWERIPTTEVSI